MIKKVLLSFILLYSFTAYTQSDSLRLKSSKYHLAIDTLKVQSIETGQREGWNNNKNMPWIASIIVGILTVIINLIISSSARKTSLKIAKEQRVASFNSANKQEWINHVRSQVSELVTQCKLLNIEFHEAFPDKLREKLLHEKINQSKNQLALSLDSKEDFHKQLLTAIDELMTQVDNHLNSRNYNLENFNNHLFFIKANNVLESGQRLIQSEWLKIKI